MESAEVVFALLGVLLVAVGALGGGFALPGVRVPGIGRPSRAVALAIGVAVLAVAAVRLLDHPSPAELPAVGTIGDALVGAAQGLEPERPPRVAPTMKRTER